jgi:hypothetical protein
LALGAGAGAAIQDATKGEQIRLTSEQVLAFRLQSPLTVTPASRLDRNPGRGTLNQ